MYIAIEVPKECDTIEKRRMYLQSIYDWGLENLEDQEHWQYFNQFADKALRDYVSVEIFIENENDAMAIKLAWS